MEAHTFITYAGFLEVLECKAQGHPFENVPSLLPINPWLAPYPPPGECQLLYFKSFGLWEYVLLYKY